MPEKDKGIFLVCKSRNCQEAKQAKMRCTIRVMPTVSHSPDIDLNRRKFCVLYSAGLIVDISNTPNWQVSPDKPGDRNKIKKAKESEVAFYVDNPDFLEVN